MNEITMIADRLELSVYDILDAAQTKWNFLPFYPGLVGGHCIGVDPYYLAQCSLQKGLHPQIILSGRHINETMFLFFAHQIEKRIPKGGVLAVLGLTFKENVPDLRNSQVVKLIRYLKPHYEVHVYDPLADPKEALALYGLELLPDWPPHIRYDGIVAVSYTHLTLPTKA